MQIILVASGSPLAGEGQLWRAVEGEPAYRLLVDVPDGRPLDTPAWPAADIWVGRQVFPGDVASPSGAAALLAVCQEPVQGAEREFNDWMDKEHVPGLGSVPGVLAARRYEAVTGTPRYFAVYHLASRDVLDKDEWKRAGNTEWTRRMRAYTRGRVRAVFVPEE